MFVHPVANDLVTQFKPLLSSYQPHEGGEQKGREKKGAGEKGKEGGEGRKGGNRERERDKRENEGGKGKEKREKERGRHYTSGQVPAESLKALFF